MTSFGAYIITLTAAFVALDVTGKVDWPWWLVTLPLLIVVGFGVLSILVNTFRDLGD